MAAGPATLVALDGNKVPFNHPAVQDANGQRAPANGILDPNGVPLTPAAKGDVQAIGTILGTPSQDASVQALLAPMQALLAPLQDLDGKASTAAAQASQATILSQILTALGPLATDADLQAATAKMEAVRLLLAGTLKTDGSAVTQPISASAMPLPNGAATEATLTAMKNAMLAQASISESLWYDPTLSPVVYYFRQVVDNDGTVTQSWRNTDGTPATPNLSNIVPVSKGTALQTLTLPYDVRTAEAGTNVGDVLIRTIVFNLGVSPPAVTASLWINTTTGAAISAPTSANIVKANSDVTIAASALPTGASTSALQTTGNTTLASILTAVVTPALASGASTSALQTAGNTSLATMVTSLASILTQVTTPALPSGAATSALQTTGNTSLATLATNSATELQNDATAIAAISAATIREGALPSAPPDPFPTGASGKIGALAFVWQYTKASASSLATAVTSLASLVSALTQKSATGTLGAANASVPILGGPYGAIGYKLTGTSVQTLSAFGTRDGTTYDVPLSIITEVASPGVSTSGQTLPISGTGPFFGYVEAAGCIGVALVTSAYISGSLAATLTATPTSRSIRARAPVSDPLFVALSSGGVANSKASPAFVATTGVGIGADFAMPMLTNAYGTAIGAPPVGAKGIAIWVPPGATLAWTVQPLATAYTSASPIPASVTKTYSNGSILAQWVEESFDPTVNMLFLKSWTLGTDAGQSPPVPRWQ